ncbi:hypothetical protein NFI96_009793 [Prochilodus magdalenae]|nr:hypothetical protein NFI96_009793 [Prochilodus magdalenae]
MASTATLDSFAAGNSTMFLDSEFRYSLFPAFYGVVFILGLLANIYALFILHRMRDAKAMNEMRIYMTNLTVADLLFICILPFWIDYYYRNGNWVSSEALCRITGTLFFINTYCSIFFLTVISVNRYWAVTRPLVAASSDCWRRGILVAFFVWVITLAAAANQLIQPSINQDGDMSRCFEAYHNQTHETKVAVAAIHFVIIAIFFVVFMLVIACNVLIAGTLLKQPISQPRPSTGRRPQGTKRRALRMLCAVVGVFVVCFLPHHVVQGPWTLAVLQLTDWSQQTRQSLNDAHQITLMLMGLNCLLDPVVYCFATRKFRKYIQGHMKRFKDGKACSNNTTTTGISMKINNHNEMSELLTEWCAANNLSLNVSKTKELIIDFRKGGRTHTPLNIGGTLVERVSSFKFLGVHLAEDLTWTTNTSHLVRKAQQRLHFLRRLRRVYLPQQLLCNFYRSTVESILTSCITVWYELPAYSRHMRPGIVVHQEEPRTHCTSAGSDNGSEDFIPMPNSSQGAVVEPAEVKPALICEKHKAPVADLPILVSCGKCQSSSTVLPSEHRAHYRTSGPQATLMRPVSDCLYTRPAGLTRPTVITAGAHITGEDTSSEAPPLFLHPADIHRGEKEKRKRHEKRREEKRREEKRREEKRREEKRREENRREQKRREEKRKETMRRGKERKGEKRGEEKKK